MATAAQVITAALQRILVQGSEADLQPDEFQDAIFAMNNYMLALDAEGVTLGYTLVSNLGDDITIPTGALRGLIANLAIEVSPDYNGTISPGLAAAASQGEQTMRLLGQHVPSMRYPSTLPVGSGNEGGSARFLDQHFFPDLEAEILAETTGCISQETGTAAATDGTAPIPVPVPNFTWLNEEGGEFTSPLAFLDEEGAIYAIPDVFLDEDGVPHAL